MELKDKK